MKEDTKSTLIKMASEMVRGVGMPDMEFIESIVPKRTSRKVLRELNSVVQMARRQALNWGVRVRDAVDSERAPKNQEPRTPVPQPSTLNPQPIPPCFEPSTRTKIG